MICFLFFAFFLRNIPRYDLILCNMEQLVVNFKASWCLPSRKIAPIYQELASTYTSMIFVTIDVEELAVSNQKLLFLGMISSDSNLRDLEGLKYVFKHRSLVMNGTWTQLQQQCSSRMGGKWINSQVEMLQSFRRKQQQLRISFSDDLNCIVVSMSEFN